MSFGDDVHYNDSHRAFAQAFLGRSVLTFEDARPILAEILTQQDGQEVLADDITLETLTTYIQALNARLSPLDFEIRNTRSQHDRTRIWALVNTTSDSLTQLATTHSADEIAFVKRVLDAMFETHNTRNREVMAVKGTQAIQLGKVARAAAAGGGGGDATQLGGESEEGQQQVQAQAQGITMKDAERVMKQMVEEGWFEHSREGYYSLSPRALMELRDWLVETYNEEDDGEGEAVQRIKFCEACREIVTVGQRCSNYDCNCRFHNACTQQFFRNQQERKCPLCQADWEANNFVGEKAATMGSGRRSTGGPSRRSNVTRDEEDDD